MSSHVTDITIELVMINEPCRYPEGIIPLESVCVCVHMDGSS